MKKHVRIVMAISLLIALTACQGENDNKQQDQTTTPHSLDKDS
nr:hypothetical protein [Acinetobacter ihumii]